MKTMQKTIALTVSVLISGFAFSHVSLGTQAATNAAVSTNAIKVKPVVSTAAQSTRAVVSTTKNTGAAVKAKTTTTVDATTTKTVSAANEVKNDVKSNADINA